MEPNAEATFVALILEFGRSHGLSAERMKFLFRPEAIDGWWAIKEGREPTQWTKEEADRVCINDAYPPSGKPLPFVFTWEGKVIDPADVTDQMLETVRRADPDRWLELRTARAEARVARGRTAPRDAALPFSAKAIEWARAHGPYRPGTVAHTEYGDTLYAAARGLPSLVAEDGYSRNRTTWRGKAFWAGFEGAGAGEATGATVSAWAAGQKLREAARIGLT